MVANERSSEGRRQLLVVLRTTSRRAVARAVGVSTAAVGFWACANRVPLFASRWVLLDKYRIPLDAWDQPEAPVQDAEREQCVEAERRAAVVTEEEARVAPAGDEPKRRGAGPGAVREWLASLAAGAG